MPPRRLSYPGGVRLPHLSPSAFRTLVLVTLVSLVVITVVGAGVRLTESGLGCSTWPRCEPDSFTPRSASDGHAMVEFANRMLNAVVGLLSVATVVGALRREPRRADLVRWSWGLFAWVASNGIVGAFVVWLHLSPVSVIAHFALALGAIWNALVLHQRAGEADDAGERRRVDATDRFVTLAKVQIAAAVVVLFTGTLVTGSGPHAGDERADRLDLTVGTIARVHGLSMVVFLLVTLALIHRAHRGDAGPASCSASTSCSSCSWPRRPSATGSTSPASPRCSWPSTCSAPRWCGWRCCGCGCRCTRRSSRPPSPPPVAAEVAPAAASPARAATS